MEPYSRRDLVFKIERQVFAHQQEFEETYHKAEAPPKPNGVLEGMKVGCSRCTTASVQQFFKNLFPILVWLPKYSWRSQLVGDCVAGATVAIMHIPQGMGYALLGGVSPIVGIYMAFFPVLIYVLTGTSHHISLGTFAVTTLMTGKIVDQHASHVLNVSLASASDGNATTSTYSLSNIQVATAVCLMVGLWQLLMGVLRLGVLGIILSDALVSGFTTASAIHVVVSQARNLMGIHSAPRFNGPFKLPRSVVAICSLLPEANVAEIVTSAITIAVLAVHNDWIKPWYGSKMRFPLPTELAILVLATVISHFGHLHSDFDVKILNHIPTGFPIPSAPPLQLLPRIMMDTVAVAIVAYAVSLSMAKIFARKRKYAISNNQELLAQGAANVFGSFFSCMPVSASLSRSMLQESVGGETQLASLVSCSLLLVILLWVGPFFESLPLAVLASVIVVALKGMFVQVTDFTSALKTSKLDALVWLVTFLSVVVIDIDIGLLIGVMASISVLVYRGHRPYAAILGHLPGTEMHVDICLFPHAVEFSGVKIFRWAGAIHFANAEAFRHELDKHLTLQNTFRSPASDETTVKDDHLNEDPRTKYGALDLHDSQPLKDHESHADHVPIEHLILDCSALSYVDLTGTKILSSLHVDLMKMDIALLLAGCSEPVLNQLDRCLYFHRFPKAQVYPSINDAVLSIQHSTVSGANPSHCEPVSSIGDP